MCHLKNKAFYLISTLLLVFSFFSIFPAIVSASPTVNSFNIPTSNAEPFNITSGPDGNLWFTELNANKIGQLTPLGQFTEFNIPSSNAGANYITSGPDGNLWFTELNANKIGRITPSGVITEFTIPSSNSAPQEITLGPDGNLWFTEGATGKLGKITPSGVITEYAIPYSSASPWGIVSDGGYLWFTDDNNLTIGRSTTSGVITEYPTDVHSAALTDLTVGPNDTLWYINSSITGTSLTSRFVGTYSINNGTSNLFHITSALHLNKLVSAGDYVYATSSSPNELFRIDSSGNYVAYPLNSLSSVNGITVGPDGNLWLADSGTNQIDQFIIPPTPTLRNTTVDLGVNQTSSINVINGINNIAPNSLTITDNPLHGNAEVVDGSLIQYTPNTNFTGIDSLTYSVCSITDINTCSTATITYTISSLAPDTGYGTPINDSSSLYYFLATLGIITIIIGAQKLSKTNDK
jgi:virginiamycin B lyase